MLRDTAEIGARMHYYPAASASSGQEAEFVVMRGLPLKRTSQPAVQAGASGLRPSTTVPVPVMLEGVTTSPSPSAATSARAKVGRMTSGDASPASTTGAATGATDSISATAAVSTPAVGLGPTTPASYLSVQVHDLLSGTRSPMSSPRPGSADARRASDAYIATQLQRFLMQNDGSDGMKDDDQIFNDIDPAQTLISPASDDHQARHEVDFPEDMLFNDIHPDSTTVLETDFSAQGGGWPSAWPEEIEGPLQASRKSVKLRDMERSPRDQILAAERKLASTEREGRAVPAPADDGTAGTFSETAFSIMIPEMNQFDFAQFAGSDD